MQIGLDLRRANPFCKQYSAPQGLPEVHILLPFVEIGLFCIPLSTYLILIYKGTFGDGRPIASVIFGSCKSLVDLPRFELRAGFRKLETHSSIHSYCCLLGRMMGQS